MRAGRASLSPTPPIRSHLKLTPIPGISLKADCTTTPTLPKLEPKPPPCQPTPNATRHLRNPRYLWYLWSSSAKKIFNPRFRYMLGICSVYVRYVYGISPVYLLEFTEKAWKSLCWKYGDQTTLRNPSAPGYRLLKIVNLKKSLREHHGFQPNNTWLCQVL